MNQNIWNGFYALEGLDGAGTTTQLNAVCRRLEEKGLSVYKTCEPTDSPVGRLIRSYLKNEFTSTPETLAYLFAADRNDHLFNPVNGIGFFLKQGGIVVSDRYFFSSQAYQSVNVPFETVRLLNSRFPLPAHLFFLDITPENGLARLDSRAGRDIFENISFLTKVKENYLRILEMYGTSEMKITVIDASQPPEKITSMIVTEIEKDQLN